ACSNVVELCDKQWSSIVHLGAHDSPFIRSKENEFSVSGNQYFDVKVQLDAGIRLLQGQIHNEDDKTVLCHSSCKLFDGGLLENYLKKVREWMDQHTSEVVTILLVNNAKIPATTIKGAFDKADLTRLTYTPPTQPPLLPTGWPTLRQLITAQRTVIAFTSTSADTKNVPWLLGEFSYIFETPFEVRDPSKFTCAAHRPRSVGGPDKLQQALRTRIPFMNRFLYSNIFSSKVGNWVSGGEAYKPNDIYYKRVGGFVLVDFFNEGSPIEVVDTLNGVSNPIDR
ncbi:PLC-like phosphodiesterase, partial [Tuber indicum]